MENNKHIATKTCIEITKEDVCEWNRLLDEAGITIRQVQTMMYCPHVGEIKSISVPLKEGECQLCFDDTFGKS